MNQYKSNFLMNHVGYLPNSSKRFVYTGKCSHYKIQRLHDLNLITIFNGKFDEHSVGYRIGDFSEVTEEGIYRISTEDGNSRCFIVSNDVYKTVARVLTNYFTWQRCADDLGWNGKCHVDDEIILKNGETRALSGGHHQSSDLRKWTFGTAIGIEGLAEYAINNNPPWDRGVLAEELWHSAKYYLSLITDEGWLINCTWVPEDYDTERAGKGYGDYNAAWKKRKYFEVPDSEHSHWQMIKTLATIADYFKDRNGEAYEKCLEGAEKVWKYMQGDGQKLYGYQLPILPPLGHDGMAKMFQGFYKDSALRYASCVEAACKLFKLTKKEEYKLTAFSSLDNLCKLQVGGGSEASYANACFWESKDSNILSNNYYYFHCINIPMAFVDALTLWPDAENQECWTVCMKNIAEQYKELSTKNPFGRIPSSFYTEDNDVFSKAALFSFSITTDAERKNESVGKVVHNGKSFHVFSEYYNFCYNLDLIAAGIFMLKAAKLTDNKEYKKVAQSQLDWLMGSNQFDASSIEGVGYNQPHRGIFGEFFPPVPQIPGAVFTGITEECFEEAAYGYDCEYDMPMVGWLLYLYSQLENDIL